MASLNKVQLIGNLGADPEIKTMQSGARMASLRVATSESWKDKQTGDRKEITEWHTVIVWSDGLVDVIERYLQKGSKVFLEGTLKTRKWQDQSGNDRYSTEVVLQGFDSKLIMLDAPAANGGRDRGHWDQGRGEGRGRQAGGGARDGRQRDDSRGGGNRGRGGGGGDWGGGSDWGGRPDDRGDRGGSGGSNWGGGQGSFADDLDDDIPF